MSKIYNYLDKIKEGFFSTRKKTTRIAFIDVEVGVVDQSVYDYGACNEVQNELHSSSKKQFSEFIAESIFICGHNILRHDLKYLSDITSIKEKEPIDTLFLSPLLFPKRPYHKLLKDDKLLVDELNNPLNDCKKARDLFYAEVEAFNNLSENLKAIYWGLLHNFTEFRGFFNYLQFNIDVDDLSSLIKREFSSLICKQAPLSSLCKGYPLELAYALALISTQDSISITPPWLAYNFPYITNVLKQLTNTPCTDSLCGYCREKFDVHKGLQTFFGYNEFRTFEGETLQEKAVKSAVKGESLLAVFPTGGGKSLTFQLPALISGQAMHGLTVVISPLQSLMKDQVDNLAARGIIGAVTINGLLDPISRADAFEQVENGKASLLYISPEMLRSKTIERLLVARNVVRFVIDEAHCFSSWGQDFRVDYLYIGDFIRKLQKKKNNDAIIPVSCFTATAKQKVITDICDYFKRKLNLSFQLFTTPSVRKNLHYSVLYAETEDEKYSCLRDLILANSCPTIVYVSRTKKTIDLVQKLSKDGFSALPFNGKMDPNEKIANQNDFMANNVQVMVATSAFGMGVDKKDIGLVVHYDISDSLENYVQEAGRAGRDPSLQAKCYVLYSDKDLDKHFLLLNQTKVSISEIQQVWSAIKKSTRNRKKICCSSLEIARQAGWTDEVTSVEMRVRTAISALEEAGYVSRGNNVPQVFATGILVKNMEEARERIINSSLFENEKEKQVAIQVIKSLITKKSVAKSVSGEAESRIDYLADMLGLSKAEVIGTINVMRQEKILADSKDMSVFIDSSEIRPKQILEKFARLEKFLLTIIANLEEDLSYKELNERALQDNLHSNIKQIKTIFYFLSIKSYIKVVNKKGERVELGLNKDFETMMQKYERRIDICRFIIESLYKLASLNKFLSKNDEILVPFSVNSLLNEYQQKCNNIFNQQANCYISDIEEALLYLSKIGSLKLEGGFLVVYNALEINRLKDLKYRYKLEDYKILDEFYKQKIQQIHIVGEYANLMVRDYNAALQYVYDYFQLDFKKFIHKYFKGDRVKQIEKNITPQKYHQLFGELSEKQRQIINDNQSKYIVVAAGPGSGKTRVLVHKLASLLLLEDVKHEQLLMLTFSRASATEFKQRLIDLIGNAAHFVEIKTFHSYSFDLLGKIGNIDEVQDVVAKAVELIEAGEVEPGKINKVVLVIDEAQDMDKNEYRLVRALMKNNEEMRVIAVGDDDQNIYQFRGANSQYMMSLITEMNATKYEMVENYRSVPEVVNFANQIVSKIDNRMKSSPIISVLKEKGDVRIVKCDSENIETPLINRFLQSYCGERACVLTRTNEEAALITGLLLKHKINARLIQSIDGFNFCNLAEIRYFLKHIDGNGKPIVIDENCWQEAKVKTLKKYHNSACLDFIEVFFDTFQKLYPTKYRSDLHDFIIESNIEDFCKISENIVLVSTIHKAKGREFDTVYMMLANELGNNSERVRTLYVGTTRAKRNLCIFSNTSLFDKMDATHETDTALYSKPEEIILSLSLRDVFLSFFKDKKKEVLKMRSGDKLHYANGNLYAQSAEPIARLSKKMCQEIADWESNGYFVNSAKVEYIVAWRKKDEEEEIAVILPELLLRKRKDYL